MIKELKISLEEDKEFLERVKKFGAFSEYMQDLDEEDIKNLDKMIKCGALVVNQENGSMGFLCYGNISVSHNYGPSYSENLSVFRFGDKKSGTFKSLESAIEFLFEKRRDWDE